MAVSARYDRRNLNEEMEKIRAAKKFPADKVDKLLKSWRDLNTAWETGKDDIISQHAAVMKQFYIELKVSQHLSMEGQRFMEKLCGDKDINKPGAHAQRLAVGKGDENKPAGRSHSKSPDSASRPVGSEQFSKTVGPFPSGTVDPDILQSALKAKDAKLQERVKELDEANKEIQDLQKQLERADYKLGEQQKQVGRFEQQANEMYGEKMDLQQKCDEYMAQFTQVKEKCGQQHTYIEEQKKKTKAMHEHMDKMSRDYSGNLQKLVAERDDLRDRYSQLAGARLKDSNPDIADLSDSNRATKLAEKFGTLYDDEWTDAFMAQTDTLKKSNKEAIQNLLNIVQDCYGFCREKADQQMETLKNVFLHPSQDPDIVHPGGRDKPRIRSKEDKSLKELRKQIGVEALGEIKQSYVKYIQKKYNGRNEDLQLFQVSREYYERCAEVCWMMSLHDPPLYMEMAVKDGAKIDLSQYTAYSAPGDKVDYLVWPPLYIGQGGGLLSKGVVEPVKQGKKIKK